MIKNADMPAMPSGSIDTRATSNYPFDESGRYLICSGMTKRETIAMHIMAGFASDPKMIGDINTIADGAIFWADTLLRKLEETK